MVFEGKVLRVEPMQTYRYGHEDEREMRTQAILVQLNFTDQIWLERRSPLLDAYDGSEFDSDRRYLFMVQCKPMDFTSERQRHYYRTDFEVTGISESPNYPTQKCH